MSEQFVSENGGVWAIVELMGHVKVAGRVTEDELFGAKIGRIDIPKPEGGFTTQYFGGSSVYRLTPTDETTARLVAIKRQPQPVYPWQLQLPGGATAIAADLEAEDF